MNISSQQRNSFLLRIWREGEEDSLGWWRGWMQHIQTGEARYVDSLDEIIRFLEEQTGELEPPPRNRLK